MTQDENKVKVVVYPSGVAEDTLTVSDAMQQVLDYFALLSKAEARDPVSGISVVWRLESATTNSPFTVEAMAVSSDPEVSIDRQAHMALQSAQDGLSRLFRGESKPLWFDSDAESIMRRILARNLNGIRRTDFLVTDEQSPIILDHWAARRAQNYLDVKAAEAAALVEDLSRQEHGSVEGNAVGLTTHYKKPALVIRERLSSSELRCVLPTAVANAIGAQHQWNEVWDNQRILVSGLCHYDKHGKLILIEAEEIKRLKAKDVSITEIRDPNFSNGLSSQQHLDKLWGEDNG